MTTLAGSPAPAPRAATEAASPAPAPRAATEAASPAPAPRAATEAASPAPAARRGHQTAPRSGAGGHARVALPVARGRHAGVALAAAGAAGYGVTVVIGRRLAQTGLPAATALGTRFAIAALVLGGLLAMRRVALPARRATLALLALGAVGYAGQSTLFYLSLQHGTAATSILLFYAYPALVCLVGWLVLRERRPCRRTWIALALAAAGTALVATATAGGTVAIHPLAVLFALCSALVFALYVLAGQRLASGCDAMLTAACVAAGAAVASVAQGIVTHSLQPPAGQWPLLLGYGLFTAAAFTLMFAALARLGARHTSVVMTLEAVFAVALAALLLGEPLSARQAIGGAAVLAATVVVARTRAT